MQASTDVDAIAHQSLSHWEKEDPLSSTPWSKDDNEVKDAASKTDGNHGIVFLTTVAVGAYGVVVSGGNGGLNNEEMLQIGQCCEREKDRAKCQDYAHHCGLFCYSTLTPCMWSKTKSPW